MEIITNQGGWESAAQFNANNKFKKKKIPSPPRDTTELNGVALHRDSLRQLPHLLAVEQADALLRSLLQQRRHRGQRRPRHQRLRRAPRDVDPASAADAVRGEIEARQLRPDRSQISIWDGE